MFYLTKNLSNSFYQTIEIFQEKTQRVKETVYKHPVKTALLFSAAVSSLALAIILASKRSDNLVNPPKFPSLNPPAPPPPPIKPEPPLSKDPTPSDRDPLSPFLPKINPAPPLDLGANLSQNALNKTLNETNSTQKEVYTVFKNVSLWEGRYTLIYRTPPIIDFLNKKFNELFA